MSVGKKAVGNLLLILGVLGLANLASSADPEQPAWSQWRGPKRDGSVSGTKLPDSLKDLEQAWKIKLGPSYSGPIVTNDRIYVTETKSKRYEVVRALDRATGKEIWQTQWEGAMTVPFFAKANGDWIRATPVLDGNRLYVAGIRDVLVCLDTDSGKELWRFDFPKKMKTSLPSFGFASSPMIHGDHIYTQAGGGFCKIEKETGKLVWRALADGGGMFGSAFSSPILCKLHGVEQFVVQTRTALTGVDPANGKPLWKQSVPAFRGMNILTPTIYKNSVFTSSYGGKSFLFSIEYNNGQWAVKKAWENKAQGYMSSPVIVGEHVYLHLRNRRVTCLDLNTGRTRWTTKSFGQYWSMITDQERILALDQKGSLMLVNANPSAFELVDQKRVANDSWAHLAVHGNQVIIRALDHVAVYRFK